MFGSIQFGLFLACIVLFVPMGMAGYHLSRNKVLFFSGALFITLAVCVHLTPYFPLISNLVSSTVQSVVVFDSHDACINLVNEIVWDVVESKPRFVKNETLELGWGWSKSPKVGVCEFQKLGKVDASDLLNGSWVVVVGDLQARFVVLSLLNVVLDNSRVELVKGEMFKRHIDYSIEISEIGMRLDFVWAPFETNLTDLMVEYKRKKSYPDVLVMGSGLWHMLRVTNSSDYSESLKLLRKSVVSLLPFSPEFGSDGDGPVTGSVYIQSPHLFWLGMPMLINGMLNTEEKREKMTDKMWHAYDSALSESKLLRQFGGPLLLLDVQLLSWNCGPRCTVDGMHYDRAVYDAAVHVMLNALLIESHQKL